MGFNPDLICRGYSGTQDGPILDMIFRGGFGILMNMHVVTNFPDLILEVINMMRWVLYLPPKG